ncbi:MAG: signal peptidase I [Planctomycetota bacterium]
MTSTRASKAVNPPRLLRDNLESFSIAIVIAILMKFFAIEAYQIPTSSMQPTMMGSSEAGIFDRILVDKTAFLFRDPERWEIAVFRYPQRRQQNYVKRIAGVPGDRMQIVGGNVYTLDENDRRVAQPRPANVQDGHWKEIYPARSLARRDSKTLGTAIRSAGSAKWSESEPGTLSAKQTSTSSLARLQFENDGYEGLVNHVWDGYAPDVSRAIQKGAAPDVLEVVQDARVRVRPKTGSRPKEFTIALRFEFDDSRENPPKRTLREFRLKCGDDGNGRLEASGTDLELKASETFSLDVSSGPELEFVHLDDSLYLIVDGSEVARLDVADFTITERMIRAGEGTGQPTGRITIDTRGGGNVTLEKLRIDRDLHYTVSSAGADAVFVVTEDHYFMLGDNTLQSVDSREWESVTIGVDAEGRIVAPDSAEAIRTLTGNSRAFPLGQRPDPDENPVPITSEGKIVFEDSLGEVWVLDGVAGDESGVWSGGSAMRFRASDAGVAFAPNLTNDRLVRREDILGRPLVTFWRAPWPRFLPIY